jgi:hypothetical protein
MIIITLSSEKKKDQRLVEKVQVEEVEEEENQEVEEVRLPITNNQIKS